MTPTFPAITYIERRSILMEKVAKGLILILGNEDSPMNYTDNPYPFRQDSSFLYYSGIDRQNLVLALDADSGEVVLYGNDFSIDDIVWMGHQPQIAEQAAEVGIHKTGTLGDLEHRLNHAVSDHRIIHYLPPYRQANTIKLANWLRQSPAEIITHPSRTLIKTVILQRSIKSEEELEQLELAVNLTRDMHLKMMEMAQPGVQEQSIHAAVTEIALAAGSMSAYPNIISIHGETLHNHAHGNILQKGQFLVGDFGGESPMHYAGDITRTCPVGGELSEIQKSIYNLVLKAEVDSINAVVPGKPYLDIHLDASRIIASGLKDLGLMRGDTEEAVAAGAHALFFPHGLGHMLGLDVHDMEDLGENLVGYLPEKERSTQFGLKSLRLARPLLPGFVFTVEPGIYFIPTLIDLWREEKRCAEFLNYTEIEKLKDFGGIRIEDNVVVTDDGRKILGKPIPKTAEEVCEVIRNAG